MGGYVHLNTIEATGADVLGFNWDLKRFEVELVDWGLYDRPCLVLQVL